MDITNVTKALDSLELKNLSGIEIFTLGKMLQSVAESKIYEETKQELDMAHALGSLGTQTKN